MNEEFKPIETWHRTNTYVGTGEIKPLPVTRYDDADGTTLNSIWKLPSLWARIKFLFDGRITLRVYGGQQPPIAVVRGDIFGDKS